MSDNSNDIMPPLAPSYKHPHISADKAGSSVNDTKQEIFDILMNDVTNGRMENVHIGKENFTFKIEDAHSKDGAIEFTGSLIPKSESANQSARDQTAKDQPVDQHPPQSLNQPAYQQPYQAPYQSPYSPPYQLPYQQSPYQQTPYQTYQVPYSYAYPYQFSSYPYPYQFGRYTQHFPNQYSYAYPLTGLAGNIINAIDQLTYMRHALRR